MPPQTSELITVFVLTTTVKFWIIGAFLGSMLRGRLGKRFFSLFTNQPRKRKNINMFRQVYRIQNTAGIRLQRTKINSRGEDLRH